MNETTNETVVENVEEVVAEPTMPVAEAAEAVAVEAKSPVSSGPRYELALILKPNLDDEAKAAQIEQITKLLERFGASIEKIDEWGRRRLAYEIAKHNEGFYYFITFASETSAPIEIERRIRIMENLLRYLIIRIEE